MIPENITKKALIKAIKKIDIDGVPKQRESTRYSIKYEGRLYPPKYTISLANTYANGVELDPENFNGGKETNDFLEKLGFEIVNNRKTVDYLKIATVAIQSPGPWQPSNKLRTVLLEQVISQAGKKADVLLFPAGFYKEKRKHEYLYGETENCIKDCLNKEDMDKTICLGIDGRDSEHQMALAINRQGIIAMGRKFYPTEAEKNHIQVANDYMTEENGFSRIFQVKDKKLYMAVCYDVFGIRKLHLPNTNVDAVLNLVHGFYPKGDGNAGDVYFAKYGFAGSSKQWKCPTFGAATFLGRDIPINWPTGVLWNQDDKNVQNWKYKDNSLCPIEEMEISTKDEKALIRVFVMR